MYARNNTRAAGLRFIPVTAWHGQVYINTQTITWSKERE